MKWAVVALLFTTAWTTAWAQPDTLTTPQEVVGQLGRAHDQLLIMTPGLYSKAVAEALRRAAAERGVEVFIVVSPAWAEAPGSYVASLALVSGVQVRLAETTRRFVVVDVGDDAFVIAGGLVGEAARRFDERPTYALAEPRAVQTHAGLFTETWDAAIPYRSFIDREDVP